MTLTLDALVLSQPPFRLTADWSLPPGSRVALIGPSGAGKSTLLSAISGFFAPISGRILWQGQDITPLPPAQRPVSILFQDQNLFPHLTLAQNLGLGLNPRLRLTEADRARIKETLARVGLEGMEGRKPGQLSGGQQGRAALARALLRARPILLLDEPFSALDPLLRERLRGEIQEILAAFAIPAVIISHDPEDVDAFAGTLVTYHRGRARMIADYASLRREYASAGDCLRHLQQEMQAESARAAGR